MTGPYAYAAPEYWNAGWRSVLPLPPQRKANPPDDYTGHKGTLVPSWADVMAWTEDKPNGNVALRLPRGQVGLDIDAYIKNGVQKRGRETLEAAERMWGPLPPTWRSTSRDDGISGIRLYRVVDGLRWPGTFGPGTETIHHGHRYVVAPPSIHDETGKPYRWITPTGEVSQTPPRVDELPWLPTAWVVGITENRPERVLLGAGMTDDDIKAWLANHNHGEHACGPMYDAAARILAGLHDGAHESLAGLMNIVRLAGYGHEGLFTTLGDIRKAFMAEAAPRRDGGERTAAQEWTRSLFGAVDKMVGAGELPESTGGDPCDLGIIEHESAVPPPMLELPAGDVVSDAELEDTPEADDQVEAALNAEQMWKAKVEQEFQQLAARDEARKRLQARDAPTLRRMSAAEFRNAPRPEQLVPHVLYKDSLARIYGSPGCGKSFLALDLACHVALGRTWRGSEISRGRVFYVMAEGQAVNVLRTEAWCERNDVDFDDLEGWFDAFPDALSLTESAVEAFVEECRRDRPALVILDTKNAMMVGEENSASDFAVMRRALDAIRKACDACVVLIDHTGYEGTRARGSSAATAGMDTELFVEKNDDKPPMVKATVTRDKAAEIGSLWAWRLRMAGEAAALVPIENYVDGDEDRRVDDGPEAWRDAIIPTELIDVEGAGKKSIPDLARLMAHDANQRAGDPAGVGMTRQEAFKVLEAHGHDKPTVRRAWSRLIDMGYLEAAEGVKAAHLRHLWAK